jgi:hypothetical protein
MKRISDITEFRTDPAITVREKAGTCPCRPDISIAIKEVEMHLVTTTTTDGAQQLRADLDAVTEIAKRTTISPEDAESLLVFVGPVAIKGHPEIRNVLVNRFLQILTLGEPRDDIDGEVA